MNINLRTASLPRAKPEQVSTVVAAYKQKFPGTTGEDFRQWCYGVVNHWFPPGDGTDAAKRGPFCSSAWCEEDVLKCMERLR